MSTTGTGRLWRRGKVWWIDYSFRGKRVRESSKSHRKKDAQALLRRRMGEIGKGRLIGPDAEKVTFEELVEIIGTDYKVNGRKSLKRLKGALKNLAERFAGNRALDITTDRVKRYIADRQEAGAANSTIRNELNALRRAFRLAVQAEQLDRVPHIPSVRVDAVREGFLTMKDVDAVVARMGPDLGPVVRFAALTGWRKSEILNLTWARVDFEAQTVRLASGSTKNGEAREFPFGTYPALADLLSEQRRRTRAQERETGEIIAEVFHRNGRKILDLRGKWKNASRLAGLEGYVFHDLRRTAVRNLERAGVPRSVAMKLTGHKTESVHVRYAIADRVAMEEGVEKLAALHGSGRKEERSVVPIQEAKGA